MARRGRYHELSSLQAQWYRWRLVLVDDTVAFTRSSLMEYRTVCLLPVLYGWACKRAGCNEQIRQPGEGHGLREVTIGCAGGASRYSSGSRGSGSRPKR